MKQAFHFKGNSYVINTVNINIPEFSQIENLLNLKLSQSKYFFQNTTCYHLKSEP